MIADQKSSRAVVLLSGGLDSATLLAIAAERGHKLYPLTFRYGQRHEGEVEAAKKIVRLCGISSHHIIDIDLKVFGGSALTSDLPVPKDRSDTEIETGIPITYVPARNTIFLSYALALAEVKRCDHIYIGVNAVDYSGYADCRPEYIEAFSKLARLATKIAVEGEQQMKIETPLIDLSKANIIRRGLALGVDYSMTRSCYDLNDLGSCGSCDACKLRLKGFAECGISDPAPYR